MDTKPDIVWELLGAEVLGVTSALKAAGYTGHGRELRVLLTGSVRKIPSVATTLDGSVIQASTPVIESESPQVQQMVKDYKAIGKDVADISFGGEYAWMTADLMIAMMKKVAPNFDKLVPTVSKGFAYKPPKDGVPFNWPSAYNSAGPCMSREGRRHRVPDRHALQLRWQAGQGRLSSERPLSRLSAGPPSRR